MVAPTDNFGFYEGLAKEILCLFFLYWLWRLFTYVKVLCKKRIGNSHKTRFWEDVWLGEASLCVSFPRLYLLECHKDMTPRGVAENVQEQALGSLSHPVSLSSAEDRWVWLPNNSGDFSVASTRSLVAGLLLPASSFPTKWVWLVTIKVNVFAWKLVLDKLSTWINLSKKGLDIPSLCCQFVVMVWNRLITCSFHVH
uniref:Reverse transcriptase zinc-binding domain-containing protein n=1 Tax=Lactuca sativa TaxID=4236 RepID=A0A9R1UK99_LACSA|nr:hypothetical protein LSAT_V11C900503060 [Lactuca sativa]